MIPPSVHETRKTQAYSCKAGGIHCICQCLVLGNRVTVLGGTSHFRGNGRMGSSRTTDLFGNAVQLCPHHESGISPCLLAGYVVTLGLAGLVLFLSALFKNPYVVIVTAFLYLCVPCSCPRIQEDTCGYICWPCCQRKYQSFILHPILHTA